MERDILLTPIRINELESLIENSVRKVLKELSYHAPIPLNDSDLLSIKEASKFLNLAVPTIYGLVSNSTIPHMKKMKKLYFSRLELTDWIKTGKRKTITEKQYEENNILVIPKKRNKK